MDIIIISILVIACCSYCAYMYGFYKGNDLGFTAGGEDVMAWLHKNGYLSEADMRSIIAMILTKTPEKKIEVVDTEDIF